MMDYIRRVILVAFYLANCWNYGKTYGELVCQSKEWAIAGRNIVIKCQSTVSVGYITVTKRDDHGNFISIITCHWINKPIFYDDSSGMRYPERLKVTGDLQNGTVDFNLTDAISSDSGQYNASYKTSNDMIDRKIYINNINVFVPPSISGCGNTTVVEESTLKLTCVITGSEPINTTWFKGSKTLVNKSLTIPEIKRGDEGWYNISAANQIENMSFIETKRIFVQVNYKPEDTEIKVVRNTSSDFFVEDQIQIFCKATANPPADFVLYKKLVQKNISRCDGGQAQGLFAVNLDQTGNNTFICVPYNVVGSGQNQSVSIFVKDRLENSTNSSVRLDIILPIVIIALGIFVVAAVLSKKKCSCRRYDDQG